jgi:hypothetical protein
MTHPADEPQSLFEGQIYPNNPGDPTEAGACVFDGINILKIHTR